MQGANDSGVGNDCFLTASTVVLPVSIQQKGEDVRKGILNAMVSFCKTKTHLCTTASSCVHGYEHFAQGARRIFLIADDTASPCLPIALYLFFELVFLPNWQTILDSFEGVDRKRYASMILDWDRDGLRGICRTYLEDPLRSHYQLQLEDRTQIVSVMTEVEEWRSFLPAFDAWKRGLVQSLPWDRLRASLESSHPFPFQLCSSLLAVVTDDLRPQILQLLSARAEAACSELVCVDLSRPLVPDAALEAK
ncbi:hypothetical protein WA588_005432, partial [Blastocystis sp. NMH]